MGTQPSDQSQIGFRDQSLNGRTTDYFVIVMKTSPLLSALLLLGFASTGMATWDWSLSNIANFKTEITGDMMVGCLGEAMRFLEENIVDIMQTVKQGARQKADGSRLGCNNGEGIMVEFENQPVGYR